MTFSTANVQEASLYQTVQLDLQSNPLVGDPSINTGDLVFFVAVANTAACVYSATPTNAFTVTASGAGGYTGVLTLPITPAVFTVGTSYYPCYLSAAAQSATVLTRDFVSSGEDDALTVWSTLYTSYAMTPTSANGGEGLVSLTITQAAVTGRAINTGLTGSNTILLVPCSATITASVTSNCADLASLVVACDAAGTLATRPTSVIALSGLTGQATGVVTGSFTVPYSPSTAGYFMCVPYCYSTAAGCGTAATAMSYTVVVPSTTPADYTLTFGAADPGTYTRTPTTPQAREAGYVYFSGAGLSAQDEIKVIRSTDECTSTTASLITNLEHGSVEVVSTTETTTSVRVYFVAPDLVTAQVVGRVCYYRAGSGLWSTAYLSAASTVADFTIDVLQPTSFTITNPSTSPTVGETLTISFAGSGLDGSVDLAYLSASTASDPCSAATVASSNSGSSSGSSSSSSGNAVVPSDEVFVCTMSGDATSAPTCTVTVDPTNTNLAMELSICYLKGSTTSQQTNYAQISGTVLLAARNPTYTVTPYPAYAGQSVALVFTGTGLSADDTVRLVSPGSSCSDATAALTTVTLSAVTEVTAGTSYQYTLVGTAETCVMVCYRLVNTANWIVARGGADQATVSSSCAATNIYLATFPVRYAIVNLATATETVTAGTQLTVAETGTLRFTTASGQSFTTATAPTAVKLVQATNTCVTAPCGAAQLAACAETQATTDYASAVTGTGGVFYTSYIQVNTAAVSYIVCVETSGGSGVYVPVLPTSETSATSTAFAFTSAAQNPTLTARTPTTWRASMSTLTSTFTGTGLDAATNVVYAVAATALLSLSTTVAVCPPVTQTPTTTLVSAVVAATSTSTAVQVRYTRADQLYDGAVVYLCYSWSTGSGDAHVTLAGSVSVAAAIPSSMTWVQPTDTTGLRAGHAIAMSFTSNLTSLSATADAVYFYRFASTANPNPNCYCDATACAAGTRVSYAQNTTMTVSTTGSIADDTVTYSAPLGFSNYDFAAVYIVCYAASTQAADTYMGRVTVAMANPTYYTVASVANTVNRVGAPINITAVRRCLTAACESLSLSDSLRLVPSTVECADLTDATSSGTAVEVEADAVQAIGSAVLGTGALSLMRRFVVDVAGTYRVCYRLASETAYSELVFSNAYVRTFVTVTTANPTSYTPTPASPSAGQFLTIDLTCATAALCSTCTMVRIVPGARASCWELVEGTYSSDSCLTVTSVQFPDQYLTAGTYTVCYGATYYTSRRIPTWLTVADANPASYTPTAASGTYIYTNQGSNYTLEIAGTGLTTADTVFLLPSTGYSCHDLRTGAIQSDGQLATWLLPSVNPYPLTLTGTEGAGVTWVVSNTEKRFEAGVLYDTTLCPGSGAPCGLQLCYLRSGTSWAPVSYLALTTSSSSSSGSSSAYNGIELVESNPSSVVFDRYPLVVDMYVMATVQGASLLTTDTVVIHDASCAGTALTVSVTGATFVNTAATEWVGVLRVTGSASSYAVCYWRDSLATEIATIAFDSQADVSTVLILRTPLYYMLSPTNFTTATTPVTQYEQLIVGGSFTAAGTTGTALTYVQLISADTTTTECNYAPFQAVAGTSVTEFDVAVTLESVTASAAAALPLFQGRLNVNPGTYALCMNTTTGLFRTVLTPPSAAGTTGSSTVLTVYDAVPATYVSAPSGPMAGQVVTLTFSATSSGASSAVATLAAGDVVSIIDGSLYECGFTNATVLAQGLTTVSSTNAAATTVALPLPRTIERDGATVSIEEQNFTICYQKQQDGSFATAPVTGGTADKNFYVMAQVPTQWTSVPTQAQVAAPITITFYGDSNNADFLTASDVAFLVPVDDGATLDAALCATAYAATSSSSSSSSSSTVGTRPVIRNGTMTKPGTVNTQWSIAADALELGAYMVCYVATNNGEPVYVSSPETLIVYETQSPTGAYLARSSTAVVDNLNVLQGERVFLLFRTAVALNVTLDNTAASSSSSSSSSSSLLDGYDVVRITTDSACATPLTAGVVDAIPDSFGYAALGLVDATTGITIPYLHLRIRADVGSYYVCMRRTGRTSLEAYYNFEVVGGLLVNPAVLVVAQAPVLAFTTAPAQPRVWMPHTNVTAAYGTAFTMADVVQFFFVPFVRNDGGSVTDSDEMAYDSCYRPSTAAEATSADVTLVDTTLQVYLASPMFTRYSFDAAGTHLLCYQTTDRNIASVYPSALTVLEASPISYTVPSVIAIQNDFAMTFVATAAIFTTTFSHEAQLYATDDATIVPNCSTSVAPSGGTTHFTTFTAANTTAASVAPTLLTAGYYYVCFVSYTDTALYFPMYAFPVPNVAGGYVFSVGLTGAQSYTVAPQPAYLGQQLHLTITGNQLSSDDRVKIVRVSQDQLSGSDSVASNGDNYASVCTADAVNADAAEANGAAGSAVSSTNAIVADYYPRVNETGTFILCYASALLADAWVWVSPVHQFTVGAARPTSYALSVTPPYETEVLYLYIYDASSDGGLLQDTDTLKLVDRGASGFDCTAAATQSSAVGLATYDSSVSNSSVHVYRVCGLSVATVTVCYALSASTVGTTVSWAEVPLQSPPETYVFAGVTIEADPFVGPFRGDLGDSSSSTTTTSSSSNAVANQWVAPRPYEPFTFYFTTTVASLEVQRVAFAQLPVTTCAVDVTYVTPLLSEKQTARASEFEVVLPYAGNYAAFLGPYAAAADPNITHSTALVVGQCDPCSFAPNYALIGGTVSLSFPSSVGGSLSDADEIRLFPISQGLAGRPCEAPEGPYAGVTLTPVAAESTSSTTVFTVSTGTEAEASTYLGEYYVCYRKVSSTTTATARFAVVAENDGTAATFSIYPVDLLTAAVCPASPMFALETAVFNVTASDTTTYPGVAFAAGDQMIVVPTDAFASSSASTADASAGCAAITDVSAFIASTNFRAQQPTLDTYGSGFSNWVLTFASQEAETSYVWCYKMLYDSVFRSIAPAAQVVEVENPYAVATTPPVVLPDSTGVVFTITGTDLATTDAVYIVPATESCAETCYRALTPTQWTATAHTVAFVNSTTVTVTFAGSLNTAVTLGVCYRRTGRYLTRLANVVVGDPNPLSYTVDFTPRVGTRPTLTFTGVNLTATDAFMLVQPGATCLLRNAVAVGAFVSVSADATTSAFTVTLTAGVVAAQSYTVCYQVSTVGAYAVVSPVLPVLDGMPTAVVTSNTPMRGRATELSVADPGEGDEMFIACPGCSCYDATTATVPYGNVSATAAVVTASSSSSTASSAAPGVSISIRVGFNDTESYPVCYKRADSGYAQIGGTSYFVTPVANSPSAVAQLPDAAAQYQGQRLHYNFSSYSTAVPLGSGDAVMLVQSSRECWDSLALSSTGIVVASSALTGTVDTTVGQWAAHVPSLGPDVPTDPSTLFPLSYVLCYRESAQAEYVSVPYVMAATTMAAADPASFTTTPAAIETGMVRANATFSYTVAGVEGDEAYMVQFTTLTNTVCDDAASTVVAARASAYPTYTFSLTGTAVAGTSNTAVCYVRSGATVAEVPQLLTVVEGNPSGYVTNITTGQTARERQYIEFTIVGTGLDAATDTVAFTDVPCAEAAEPIPSSSYLARLGDATSNGTAYVVEAQFIAAAAVSPISIYVCYQRDSVWREVGAALTLDSPQPTTVTVFPSTGLQDTPRAGQHLYLTLNGGVATIPTGAAVLSARTTGEGTWCHNFTAANVQETSLTIESATLLSVPVWETPGAARLCVLNDATVPWSDVAATVEAASIVVNPANPSSMDVYPSPPRVGQSVTLTFHLLAEATAQDAVKITTVDYTACEDAVGIPGLADAILVTTVVDSATTTVTLVDSTDPLLYRSFNATGSYRVCYYSGTEQSWSVVGGSLAAGTVTVEERVPQSWAIATGAARVGQAFALSLYDELGILQPTAGSDLVWATPSTVNCGQDPYACANCLIFGWSTDGTTPATSSSGSSVGMVATTTANATVILDSMNLCYRLAGATAALIPGALTITTGPVQCVEQTSFVSGQHQQVTFELEEGTDVTNDAWRLSFYATTAMNCEDRYVDDFVPGMAVLDSSNATAATYSVVWPVGLGVDTDRYTLCYDHNGVVGPICTCGQIAANTGDCFIMASPGSPQNFTPSPQPTYVGQTITLTFAINDAMTAYPPTAIKFVTYTGLLTSCDSAAAFTPTGATLTRVSATVYTYVFKHDYTLGTATLVVCALTDLSTSYARVASTIVPSSPSTTHTLWIRPYLTLSTFPALTSNYLRVLETVNLTFTMASQEEDDVVSAADSFTFVSDPTNCVESFIESQDAATLMAMFELGDTAFLTLPALVLSADAAAFASRSLATFANTTAGPGTHYLCYKLAAGTYAPVLPALTIGEALFASCSVTGVVSADNEDSSLVSDSGDSTTNNGGPLRAMYYAPTVILGSAVFGTVASAAADAVRVVPAAEWCTNDAAVVFSSTLVATTVTTSLQTVFFASLPGTYKVCYRFGSATTTNWSPACRGLGVRDPTPTAATTGCWNVGQTLAVALTQPVTGHIFSATDRLRFIAGTLPCLQPTLTATSASATVAVNDATQTATGLTLSDVTAGQTTYSLPAVLFRTGTTSVRLCYTDAAGNEFAVPLLYASLPGRSSFTVQSRQPSAMRLAQANPQVGQRLLLNFTSAAATVTPALVPYGTLPAVYTPGAPFDGTFDGATLLALAGGAVYVEGRCAAALRAGTLVSSDFYGVYGAVQAGSATNFVPYTIGSYDPAVAQNYIACYQLATCGVVDSGDPLRVNAQNPSDVYTVMAAPRRGQLINVYFERDTTSATAVALTPGSDRAVKQANLASCWTLADTAGTAVSGTTDLTYFTTIFYAQAPALAANTTTRSCYHLMDGSWSEVPNGVAVVQPANPASFETLPASARVDQVNYIVFHGASLGASDRVKIIAQSLNCSEDSVPPTSFAAYTPGSPNTATTATSSAGWAVMEASTDGTTARLNFTASATGTYSVCYRLATDTVWTLVYADLTIYERNPAAVVRTPVATLEGELFTLNFTASTTGTAELTANDRVVLYYGSSVNCAAPTAAETAPSVTAAPSRSDLLPTSIAFQMDAGTRGDYTLCYLIASPSMPTGYVTVWGYDVVVVAPNPENVTLYPASTATAAETPVYRANELLTYVFEGWGLVATASASDSVKLIAASALASSSSDATCQQTASAAAITYYDLYANGTHAVQVWRASAAAVGSQFAVCYKLNGGQYHAIGDLVSISAAASPSGATSAKLAAGTATTTTLSVGESMSWTLAGTTTTTCAADNALLFYSANNCHDVDYYVDVAAALAARDVSAASAAAFDAMFPAGVAVVTDCSAATLVRVPSTYTIPSTTTAAAAVTLSLCYWSARNNAVSVLSDSTITLTAGEPAVLDTTLAVTAQEVFTADLTVAPTADDWVVFVTSPDACVGTTAPTDAAYVTEPTYDTTTGVLTVTAVVPDAGTYYMCYAHRSGTCAASTGRECARVVATVAASASGPRSWVGQPSPLYVSSAVAVTLSFTSATEAAAAGQGTTAAAWLAPMVPSAGAATLTMRDAWAACVRTNPAVATASTVRHVLTYGSASGTWTMAGVFTAYGSYALCYTADSTAALHIFGPLARAGPTVLPSTVATVSLPSTVTVSSANTMVLTGGGMSTTDVVEAVAVPAATSSSSSSGLPADMCTNTAYTPRVTATNSAPAATASTGLSTMLSNLVFTSTGSYVLCYTATYGSTVAEEEAGTSVGNATPVLLTDAAFAVVSSVVSMTVLSPVLQVNVLLEVQFTGTGLSTADTAALVYVPDALTVTPTVAAVCQGSGATYTAVQSAAADGTTAVYAATPTQEGIHMVCFRAAAAGATPVLMPTQLSVGVQTAASVVFTVQPSGCTAMAVCSVQPTVTLLDASSVATAAPFSTVAMTLFLSDATTAAPAGYLGSGDAYQQVDYTNFTFYALRVSTAGTYYMRATVTLPSGGTLTVLSNAVTVADAGSGVSAIASVTCVPSNLLDRTVAAASTAIDCMVADLTNYLPDSFSVVANAGTVSAVTQNGTTSGGLPTFQFTVTAPETSSTTLVNYVSIAVTPSAPYESWPVENSPVTVCLTTAPTALTTLTCSAGATSSISSSSSGSLTALPLSNMIRVGDSLTCGVQGKATMGGVAVDVVAPVSTLAVSDYYNADVSSGAGVALGAYPSTVNGLYTFTLTPSSALNVSVAGTVQVASTTVGGAATWSAMVNSPLTFILIGTPTAAASRLACASARTGSALWYVPAEPLTCTATLANAQGSVNGLQGDYTVVLPDGGSVAAVTDTNWGPALTWRLTAAPQSTASSIRRHDGGGGGGVMAEGEAREAVETLAAVTESFGVQVRHTAAMTTIGAYTGGLVYVTRVVTPLPELTPGRAVTLTLVGVGLEATHRYALGTTTTCATVQSEATAALGGTDGQLVLSFVVPSVAFTICFAPADATTVLQALVATPYTPSSNNNGGQSGKWAGDDLVLLIIGVIFLFILLLLLFLLLWCILCVDDDDDDSKDKKNVTEEHRVTRHLINNTTTTQRTLNGTGHVYMPPRANTRYVMSAGSASSTPPAQPAPLPIAASVPQTPQQQQQQTPPPVSQPTADNPISNSTRTHVRVNIHDTDGASSPAPATQTSTPPPAPAQAAAAPPAVSSGAYTAVDSNSGGRQPPAPPAVTQDGGGKRRHRHRGHRSSSSGSGSNSVLSRDPNRTPPPLLNPMQPTSAGRYADLDRAPVTAPLSDSSSLTHSTVTASRRSLPPLPPPAGLVKSPQQQQQQPPPIVTENGGGAVFPPLPPPPASPAVTATASLARDTAPQPQQYSGSTSSGEVDGEGEMVGPFRVTGHTSTPMVRSPASSRRS